MRRRRVHWRDDGASCRFLAELYRASQSKANSVRLPVRLRHRPAPSRYHLGLSSRIVAIVSADSAAPTNIHEYISLCLMDMDSHLDQSIVKSFTPSRSDPLHKLSL